MRLEFQPQAEHDLEGLGDYIIADKPARAITFIRGCAVTVAGWGIILWPIVCDQSIAFADLLHLLLIFPSFFWPRSFLQFDNGDAQGAGKYLQGFKNALN